MSKCRSIEGEPGVRAAFLKERCRILPGETDSQTDPAVKAQEPPLHVSPTALTLSPLDRSDSVGTGVMELTRSRR